MYAHIKFKMLDLKYESLVIDVLSNTEIVSSLMRVDLEIVGTYDKEEIEF